MRVRSTVRAGSPCRLPPVRVEIRFPLTVRCRRCRKLPGYAEAMPRSNARNANPSRNRGSPCRARRLARLSGDVSSTGPSGLPIGLRGRSWGNYEDLPLAGDEGDRVHGRQIHARESVRASASQSVSCSYPARQSRSLVVAPANTVDAVAFDHILRPAIAEVERHGAETPRRCASRCHRDARHTAEGASALVGSSGGRSAKAAVTPLQRGVERSARACKAPPRDVAAMTRRVRCYAPHRRRSASRDRA